MTTKTYVVMVSFIKNVAVTTLLYFGTLNSYVYCHICCPIWVKFVVRDVNLILSSIYVFGEATVGRSPTPK